MEYAGPAIACGPGAATWPYIISRQANKIKSQQACSRLWTSKTWTGDMGWVAALVTVSNATYGEKNMLWHGVYSKSHITQ